MRPVRSLAVSFLALIALGTVGCGSAPVPVERVASSEAAIRAAREVGAPNHPKAALHLKLAQDQLDQAKALIKDGDTKRAESVLQRAEADAELAVALSRESATQAEAQQLLDQVTALRKKAL